MYIIEVIVSSRVVLEYMYNTGGPLYRCISLSGQRMHFHI